MFKLNIIAFVIVTISFSLWFSSSRSLFSANTLLQQQELASAEPMAPPSKEQILEDEIRRLKKTIKLLQNDLKGLNQDILRIDKKYMELLDSFENQITEFTAYKFKMDRLLDEIRTPSISEKKEIADSNPHSPYKLDATPSREPNKGSPNAKMDAISALENQPIPFNLILNVPSITEEQKTEYRNLFIEHNRQRNELIRNRGPMSQEELLKKLEDFRLSYEPKFMGILKNDQRAEYNKVVENYKIQREQNQKIREERKNMRLNQPGATDKEKR